MNPLDEPDKEYISVSPWSTILKYGLIGSAIMLVWSGISMAMGLNSTPNSTSSLVTGALGILFSFAVYIVIMIFAVKEHRDKKQQGIISLGKGMAVSFVTGLIMSIVSNAANLIYALVINPTFITDALPTEIDPGIVNESTMKLAMVGSTAFSFVMGCIIGAVIALIISAVMKKDPPFRPPPMPVQ